MALLGADGNPIENEAPDGDPQPDGGEPAPDGAEVAPAGLDFNILGVGPDIWNDIVEVDGKREVFMCWGVMASMMPVTSIEIAGPKAGLKVPVKEDGRISLRELRAKANEIWNRTTDAREEAIAKATLRAAEAFANSPAGIAQANRRRRLPGSGRR